MLKMDAAVPAMLATGAIVIGAFSMHSPPHAEVKTVPPGSAGDRLLGDSGRTALVTSIGVSGGIALLAKDEMIFVFGGMLALALYWSHAYARAVDPTTGSLPAGFGERYAVESAT